MLLCPHVIGIFAAVLVEAIQVVEVRGHHVALVAISTLRLRVLELESVRELDALREAVARALLVLEPNTTPVPLTLELMVASVLASVVLVLAMAMLVLVQKALYMFVVVLVLVALLLMAALVHVLLLREVSGPKAIV